VGSVGPAGGEHAFLYDTSGLHDLGVLPGFDRSIGRALNDLGEVVGHVGPINGTERAFLYNNGAMTDLNTLLDPVSGAGWVLQDALGINDSGQIVGYGERNGQMRAFLLTSVPEPSSIVLCAIAFSGLGLGLVRRRRRNHP
jgi:probable HAF family extracellular repeat protein